MVFKKAVNLTFMDKDPVVEAKVQDLIYRTEKYGKKMKLRPSKRDRSSLEQFIKTKEQADLFMKMLKMA